MDYFDEKQNKKVESSKQKVIVVLVIFIALLSFLIGVLLCLFLTSESVHKAKEEAIIAANAASSQNSGSISLSEEDIELLKTEICDEILKELDLSSETNKVDKNSSKDDTDDKDTAEEGDDDNSSSKKDKADSKEKNDVKDDKESDKDDAKKDNSSAKHRYEFVIADISWTDAEKLCRDKGGYLATITTKKEFDDITRLIEENNKTGISFYVGATRSENYVKQGDGVIAYHWVHDGGDIVLYDSNNKDFWLTNEPSFKGRTADGTEIEEMYVDMIYREADKRCYLNDVANNVLEQAPSFTGKIGYICEYDE